MCGVVCGVCSVRGLLLMLTVGGGGVCRVRGVCGVASDVVCGVWCGLLCAVWCVWGGPLPPPLWLLLCVVCGPMCVFCMCCVLCAMLCVCDVCVVCVCVVCV